MDKGAFCCIFDVPKEVLVAFAYVLSLNWSLKTSFTYPLPRSISVGALQENGCPVEFIPEGIRVGRNGIVALQQNNLFIFKTVHQSPLALAALNANALDLWHAQLGHL